jgi:hypothetical protein
MVYEEGGSAFSEKIMASNLHVSACLISMNFIAVFGLPPRVPFAQDVDSEILILLKWYFCATGYSKKW